MIRFLRTLLRWCHRRERELSDAEIIRQLVDDRHRQDSRESHKLKDDIAALEKLGPVTRARVLKMVAKSQ